MEDEQDSIGDDFDKELFGRDMRSERVWSGMKQSKVSMVVGMSAVQYGRIERGEARPNLRVFLGLCWMYNINPMRYLSEASKQSIVELTFPDMTRADH